MTPMCKIYNTIGSLTALKSILKRNNIHDFKSLKEVIDFQSSYVAVRQRIIVEHESLMEQEKNALRSELEQLSVEIETQRLCTTQKLKDEIETLKQKSSQWLPNSANNFLQKAVATLKLQYAHRVIAYKEKNINAEVEKSVGKLVAIHVTKENRYQFLSTRFSDAVTYSSGKQIAELERKKSIIDASSSYIYGALGEQKVVKVLENLSDEYYLINDFTVTFTPALFRKQEHDRIKTIQIDHILIAPSGVFLIETKNWNQESQNNTDMRSPVEQIKRTSFALFKLLHDEISENKLLLRRHHWGDKKITIRNLIVLINNKPRGEFQYVKMLTLNELLSYINYHQPVFSSEETKEIAEYLLRINSRNLATGKKM